MNTMHWLPLLTILRLQRSLLLFEAPFIYAFCNECLCMTDNKNGRNPSFGGGATNVCP